MGKQAISLREYRARDRDGNEWEGDRNEGGGGPHFENRKGQYEQTRAYGWEVSDAER